MLTQKTSIRPKIRRLGDNTVYSYKMLMRGGGDEGGDEETEKGVE